MGGGVGFLVILVVTLAAAIAGMLLTLNARWKSAGQVLTEARANRVPAAALLALAFAAIVLLVFVVFDLL